MSDALAPALAFLHSHHPFDALDEESLARLADSLSVQVYAQGATIFAPGDQVDSLRIVGEGSVDIVAPEGGLISHSAVGETFGARAILRDGVAQQFARACAPDTRVYALSAQKFRTLLGASRAFKDFFGRFAPAAQRRETAGSDASLVGLALSELMTANPVCVPLGTSVRDAATVMAEKRISCVLVVQKDALVGLLTTGDVAGRVVAKGLSADIAVDAVMTRDPVSFAVDASGFDAMLAMSGKGIGHLPITQDGRPVGIITRTNLVRRQQVSAVYMIGDIRRAEATGAIASVIKQAPDLLAQLVGSGVPHQEIGRVITSLTDAVTARLIEMAQARLGPAPVPFLWLACGSQGREEQTGISDQDNCLILHDDFEPQAHDGYFKALAGFVCDGLDEAGYFYCPGDMMATTDRWRQPVAVWKRYFETWVRKPDPKAQMLASVMFDLRAIYGQMALFEGLQESTLALAAENSIFRAHMAANSLKHTPPLGLFRGFALIRSGEHKDMVDLKHNGVVPIVDLARVYALEAALPVVNTRARLAAAQEAGSLSHAGGSDLMDAYDLIATVRLRHQAQQIRDGEAPDNFLAPSRLSAFERNHLKDAFGIIKGLQSALGHGRSAG